MMHAHVLVGARTRVGFCTRTCVGANTGIGDCTRDGARHHVMVLAFKTYARYGARLDHPPVPRV